MAAYRWTHSPSQSAWSGGWRHRLALSLYLLYEPSELLQWPCHDDNTINISIIIIIIIISHIEWGYSVYICIQCESKNPPPCGFLAFFPKRMGIF